MTNEEIRIKVAESLGWHEKPEPVGSANATAWWKGSDRYPSYLMPVPNYPESLDACAEFEATLSDEELEQYREHISVALNDVCRMGYGFTAKAIVRCLAYLKTKGLFP